MTSPTENKTEATLRQRVLSALTSGLDALLANWIVQALLIVLFGVGAAVILTPGLRRKGPEITEADVGRPARKDVKASRTFQYTPPPEVLEKRRDEAASRIVTVYNYYPNRLRLGYESLSVALRRAAKPDGLYETPGVSKDGAQDPAAEKDGSSGRRSMGASRVGRAREVRGAGRTPAKTGARETAARTTAKTGAGAQKPEKGRAAKSADSTQKGTKAPSVAGETTKQHRLDPEKVKNAIPERWELFNRVLSQKLRPQVTERRLLDRKSFEEIFLFALKNPDGLTTLEESLRAVLLDASLLDKRYVRTALELKTDIGQTQKKILVRTIRFKPHTERGEVTREEVITNLSNVRELRDLRDRVSLKVIAQKKFPNEEVKNAFANMVQLAVLPNLERDDAETAKRRAEARQSIIARPITYVKGQILVRAGEMVTREHLRVVTAMEGERSITGPWQVAAGMGLFVLLFYFLLVRYGNRHVAQFRLGRRDLFVCGWVVLGLMALAEALGGLASVINWPPSWVQVFVPVAAGSCLVRLLMGGSAGVLFSIGVAGFCSLAIDGGVTTALYMFLSALVGAGAVSKVQTRFVLWRAGGIVALVNLAMVVFLRTFAGELWTMGTLFTGASAVLGGLAAGFLASALLPVLEWMGGYTTDVSLLELANPNHPLLRELLMNAPGTHHHSMVVGGLSEAGANAIGANGLMARVAAYYHDVGKMESPQYFAENQRGDNPHTKIKPSMSMLVIKKHITRTREILKNYRIPERIQEVALSHHGTTLIEYFYSRAKEQAAEGEEVLMQDYRYPGPKPQTREAGILMLADSVDAAVRSLDNPDEEHIRTVVDRVINKKFIDGQLAECALTLRDLTKIAGAFLKVLTGMYHHRPVYPGQKEGYRPPEPSAGDTNSITTTRELKIQARAKERADRHARSETKTDPGHKNGADADKADGKAKDGGSPKKRKTGAHGGKANGAENDQSTKADSDDALTEKHTTEKETASK